MIDFITSWTQGIVVAVIIATIIEMILPNSSSKKYIKVVIGVYILFNIVVPIIDKVTGKDITLESIIDFKSYAKEIEASGENINNKLDSNNNNNIKEIYIYNLKKDIKNKIEDKGYKVTYVNVEIENNDEYTIKTIFINVQVKEEKEEIDSNIQIEQINITIQNTEEYKENDEVSKISSKNENEIREYLKDIYDVKVKNIYVNGKGG